MRNCSSWPDVPATLYTQTDAAPPLRDASGETWAGSPNSFVASAVDTSLHAVSTGIAVVVVADALLLPPPPQPAATSTVTNAANQTVRTRFRTAGTVVVLPRVLGSPSWPCSG